MKTRCFHKTGSLLAVGVALGIAGGPLLIQAQTTDLALQGAGIMGFQGAIDSTPGTYFIHAGLASAVNDGDSTSHVDDWSGGARGTNGVSFAGVVWPTMRWES